MSYYFLSASLSDLNFETESVSWRELMRQLEANLTPSHWHQLGQIRRVIDLDNMHMRWLGYPISRYGFWNESELDDQLVIHDRVERPVSDWLDTHLAITDRLALISALRLDLIAYMKKKSGIVGAYYRLRWDLELSLIALRKHLFGESLPDELSRIIEKEEGMREIIEGLNDSDHWSSPSFIELKSIFQEFANEPLKLDIALSRWSCSYWGHLEKEDNLFGFDSIAVYMLRLIEIDRHKSINR